jgi:hypothetical protein
VSSCRIMMWWSLQGVHSLFPLFTLPPLPCPPLAISRCVFIKKRHVLTHPSFRLYVIVQLYYFRLLTVWMEDSSRATDGKFVWGNNFKKQQLSQIGISDNCLLLFYPVLCLFLLLHAFMENYDSVCLTAQTQL